MFGCIVLEFLKLGRHLDNTGHYTMFTFSSTELQLYEFSCNIISEKGRILRGGGGSKYYQMQLKPPFSVAKTIKKKILIFF